MPWELDTGPQLVGHLWLGVLCTWSDPLTFQVALALSIWRLQKFRIHVIEARRIIMAGALDAVAFDKTGTLTYARAAPPASSAVANSPSCIVSASIFLTRGFTNGKSEVLPYFSPCLMCVDDSFRGMILFILLGLAQPSHDKLTAWPASYVVTKGQNTFLCTIAVPVGPTVVFPVVLTPTMVCHAAVCFDYLHIKG